MGADKATNLVEYYQNNFGMKLIHKRDFEEAKFSLYFLAFDSPGAESAGKHLTDREGILELIHNCSALFCFLVFLVVADCGIDGTENDDDYKVNTGNVEPHRDMFPFLII